MRDDDLDPSVDGLGASAVVHSAVGEGVSPVAIHNAVQECAIDRPMRMFTPGFGAGAFGRYAVLRVEPAIAERAERADEVVGVAMPNATSSPM